MNYGNNMATGARIEHRSSPGRSASPRTRSGRKSNPQQHSRAHQESRLRQLIKHAGVDTGGSDHKNVTSEPAGPARISMSERRLMFVLEPIPFPTGGVATIYRHVEILHRHGLPAYVALSKKPRVDFYPTNAPVLIYGSSFSRSHWF